MISKIIKYYIALLVVFFSWVSFASAGVTINEVQISPTEDRFIELYNSGSSTVDLTDWYIQRKTASGSDFGSLVSKPNFEGKKIDAGSYFLISRGSMSGSDIELNSLTLTESNTIQLKNSTQKVVSKIGWGDASDCENVCAPNPISGKSIQKTSGGDFIIASPTPSLSNKENESGDEYTSGDIIDDSVETEISPTVITNPNKFVITTYPTETKKLVQKKSGVAGVTSSVAPIPPEDNSLNDSILKDSEIINLNDLGASASGSRINISNTVYSLVGLLIVIALGITSFLLIKKKNNIPDYVEKEIRAEDMTIIE